jgi:hypothetical protein
MGVDDGDENRLIDFFFVALVVVEKHPSSKYKKN